MEHKLLRASLHRFKRVRIAEPPPASCTPAVLPAACYADALHTDERGLPVYAPRLPTNLQAHIIHEGEPLFLCAQAQHYKPYMDFPAEMLAASASIKWHCIECTPTEHTRMRRRIRVIGSDGSVQMLCQMCGFYMRPHCFTASVIRDRRGACMHCQAHRLGSSRHRNAASSCRLCLGESKTTICAWCAFGAPQITTGALFNESAVKTYGNVNAAAAIFGQCRPSQGALEVQARLK